MIPDSPTVTDAAAPDASLRFFFYCGIVVLPVVAAYTRAGLTMVDAAMLTSWRRPL